MMNHNNYWSMGMMWIIWLPIMVFCFLFLYCKKNKESEKESPLDILKRRYANGELTTVEYEERKKVLEGI
jgi:putative membrane protein